MYHRTFKEPINSVCHCASKKEKQFVEPNTTLFISSRLRCWLAPEVLSISRHSFRDSLTHYTEETNNITRVLKIFGAFHSPLRNKKRWFYTPCNYVWYAYCTNCYIPTQVLQRLVQTSKVPVMNFSTMQICNASQKATIVGRSELAKASSFRRMLLHHQWEMATLAYCRQGTRHET